jgi:MarR family transcriptional regulator for hemolysin
MQSFPGNSRIMFGPWLQSVARAWRAATDEAFAECGLSFSTGMALIYVHRLGGQMRQCQLAQCMGIEGPSLVRLLDQLCAASLVARRDDPADRRAKHVEIMPRGRALMAQLEPALDRLRDRLLARVSDADLAATLRVLEAIAAAADEVLPVPAMDAVA